MTLRSRACGFWTLQALGWSGYAASKLAIFPVTPLDAVWIAFKGVLLSTLLAAALRRIEARSANASVLVVTAAPLALLAAAMSLALSHQAALHGWLLQAAGTADWLTSAEALLLETLLFLSWVALYLGLRYAMELRAERERLREALALAQRAQVQMLRYQLNPHFLFNALASLRGLVLEDAARARRVIDELSGFLRYSLLDGSSESIPLAREFDAIRHYLAIQKLRFEERIMYDVQLDPAVAETRLPAFLIQPLVENAVKYGMRTSRGGTTHVSVRATRERGRCVLAVRNSGRWVTPSGDAAGTRDRSGIGLGNVRQRLAAQPGAASFFNVGPVADGVLARIEFDAA